jgi:hypothetical protein
MRLMMCDEPVQHGPVVLTEEDIITNNLIKPTVWFVVLAGLTFSQVSGICKSTLKES